MSRNTTFVPSWGHGGEKLAVNAYSLLPKSLTLTAPHERVGCGHSCGWLELPVLWPISYNQTSPHNSLSMCSTTRVDVHMKLTNQSEDWVWYLNRKFKLMMKALLIKHWTYYATECANIQLLSGNTNYFSHTHIALCMKRPFHFEQSNRTPRCS